MLKQKFFKLIFSCGMAWFFVVKGLQVDLVQLVPPEIRELGIGLLVVVGIFLFFRLLDYIFASPDKRREIHGNLLRWILPGRTCKKASGAWNDSPSLLVRESRWMMVMDAAMVVSPLTVCVIVLHVLGDVALVRLGVLVLAGLFILSSLVTLLQAIVADDLLHITAEGVSVPYRYDAVIPWDDVLNVKMRRRQEEWFELRIQFANPERAYAWRGLLGGIKGHLAHRKGLATFKIPLEHTNVFPGDVRAALDYYLTPRGGAVEMSMWDLEPQPTMTEFMR